MDFMETYWTYSDQTTIKIFEFRWKTVQRANWSSGTTYLGMKFQISVLYFYGAVLPQNAKKIILWSVLWLQICQKKMR